MSFNQELVTEYAKQLRDNNVVLSMKGGTKRLNSNKTLELYQGIQQGTGSEFLSALIQVAGETIVQGFLYLLVESNMTVAQLPDSEEFSEELQALERVYMGLATHLSH